MRFLEETQMPILTTERDFQKRLGHYPAPLKHFLENNRRDHLLFEQNRVAFSSWLIAHKYIPVALLCVDGRVSDFSTKALGLLVGIAHILRSPGLTRCTLRNPAYARRLQRTIKRIQEMHLQDAIYHKYPLFFVAAHESISHPTQGCAACKSDLNLALERMRKAASEVRSYIGHEGVVLECVVDTDRDTIKIMAPGGLIDTRQYIDGEHLDEYALFIEFQNRISFAFESQRNTIPEWKSFVCELAQLLVNNVHYARSTVSRPIELLTHQERLVIIGGPLETTDHNAGVLVERGDSTDMIEDLLIGLQIVGRNILKDALQTGSSPQIPILVGLDYDDPKDQYLYAQVTLGIVETLQGKLGDIGSILADAFSNEEWWHNAPHSFKRHVIEHRGDLVWVPAVYEQRDRLLHLVEH